MGQKVHPVGFRLGITQEHKSSWFAKPSKKGEFSQLIAEDSAIRTMLFQQLRQFGLTDVHIYRYADFLQVILYVSKPRMFAQHFQNLPNTGNRGNANESNANSLAKSSSFFQKQTNTPDNFGGQSIAHSILQTLKTVHKRSLMKQLTFQHTPDVAETKTKGTAEAVSEQKQLADFDDSKMSVMIKRSDSYNARAIAEQIREDLQKRLPFRRALKQALSVLKKSQGGLRSEIKGAKIQISGRINGSEIARTEWTREGQVPLHTLRAKIDFCFVPAFTNYGVLGIKVWIYTDH
jgi:ribosomal protein S3